MSRNVNTGRVGKARVTGPINKPSNKSDVTSGKSVSNNHRRGGRVEEGLKKFLKVSSPIFEPGSGPTTTQFVVALTNLEPGATYKYTIDGSTPSSSSLTMQSATQNLTLTGTTSPSLIFKAYGYRNDYADSDVVTNNYTLQQTQDPIFVSPSGNVPDNQLIILDIEQGATGYYTLDGTTPSGAANTTSSLYTNPFVISFGSSTSITGKAMAVKADALDSQTVSGVFTHDSNLDYVGTYDGVRDVAGKLVSFTPSGGSGASGVGGGEGVQYPSRVFLSTTEGEPTHRGVSFWGTDFYVENYKPLIKDDFIGLSAGQNHALALTQSGTVVAWGYNSLGQTDLTVDSKLTTSGEITRIDAGDSHSLALTSSKEIIAWGDNSQGQSAVPNNLTAIRISAGGEHSLALKPDRTLVGWGENSDGQIDFPSNLNDVVEISAGENHSAALIGYGAKTSKQLQKVNNQWSIVNRSTPVCKAVAWGINDLNQSTVPDALANGTPDLIAISCGGNHTLVLDANGKVFGWGDGGHNQTPPSQGMSLAEPDGSDAHIIKISAGFGHSLALSEKGTVFAWGSNQNNQINITNLLSDSVLIAGGDNYSLAYGLEPDEHIYYSTGVHANPGGQADPQILYTGYIEVSTSTQIGNNPATINAISQNKITQAASNLVSRSFSQQQLSGLGEFGVLSSKGTYAPIETGTVNPARFTATKDFVVKIHENDVQKEPAVDFVVSHPSHLSYSSEAASLSDAIEKRFSSVLTTGPIDKAFDGDKSIDNYLAFNPGGYIGYKFDSPQKVTKIDFATNADNFHKVGDGVIQGSYSGVNWEDIAFFSKKFPDSYPPFLSLDGQALDRIITLEMVSGGAGYTEEPIIEFNVASGQEGEGAKAKALFSPFALTGFSVLSGGTGFTSPPFVTVNPVIGGAGASGVAVLSTSSVVDSVLLDFDFMGEGCPSAPQPCSGSRGDGYTSAPAVTISGGGGTGATAVAYLSGTQLTGIEIIERKTPYRTAPNTTFAGGGGAGAEAIAHLTAFEVGKFNSSGVLMGVSDHKPPYGYHIYDGVFIPGIGSPLLGSAGGYDPYGTTAPPGYDDETGVYALDHFDIDNIGAGYTSAPAAFLTGGLISQTGVPYAIKLTIGERGPTSGEFIKSASDQEFGPGGAGSYVLPSWFNDRQDLDELTNDQYHSGILVDHDPNWEAPDSRNVGSNLYQYIGDGFKARLTGEWRHQLPFRMFFDFTNYAAHWYGGYTGTTPAQGLSPGSITIPLNAHTPFSGKYEHGIPGGIDDTTVEGGIECLASRTCKTSAGNLLYSENSSTSWMWRLKFHKDSARQQKIEIVGGGGQGLGGYVELINHNELLGFDDDDSLLDKLFQLYTHPDYRSSYGEVNAHKLNWTSYEQLLWSTPVNKGGKLPDEDATLIPYKLHITGAANGYTGVPTITEEFDRTFPGMMYLLEPTGMTFKSGDGVDHTALDGHHQWRRTTLASGTKDQESHGWTRLWGSGYLAGGHSVPQGSCASSATGVQYTTSAEYNYETDSYGTPSTGYYLANKYLSNNEAHRLKIPYPAMGPASAGNGAGGVNDGHPAWNNTKIVGGDLFTTGRNYAQNQIVWFSGVGDGGIGPTEIAWGTLNVDHGHDFWGNHANGHAGVTSVTMHNEGGGYNIPVNLPASGGAWAADGSILTAAGGVPGGVVAIITDVISGGEQGNLANGGTSFYAQGNVWPGMDHGPVLGWLGGEGYVSTAFPAQGWGMGSGYRTWGQYGIFGFQHHPDEEDTQGGSQTNWNGGLLSNSSTVGADIRGIFGGYTGQQENRMHEQIEFYAPDLELTKEHSNDMHSASSSARVNFEIQLAKWITFEPLMPEQSTIEAFLASGSLDRVEVTNMGAGYTGDYHNGEGPLVLFSGGLASGVGIVATGHAHTSKTVDSITLTNGGAGYQSFPDIAISGGNGFGAFAVGQKAASDITGLSLISGGKNYTESPTIDVVGGGYPAPSPSAIIKCRLPVALGTLSFTNNKNYKEYRLVGQGNDALKTSQVNEVEFYSGDYRISNFSNRNNHTLAIKSDTSLLGWGDNVNEQLPSSGITNAVSISAGLKHSLIAKENGTVVAFGDNSYGQINVPDDLTNVISVSAGDDHSLALLAGGMVRAWGQNSSGQCNVPVSLLNGTSGEQGAIAVAAGNNHSLALLGDGTVTGWGTALAATAPSSLDRVSDIAAGDTFSLALRDNGDVVSWGGVISTYGHIVPQDLKDVVAIDACNDHALALQVDGSVTGWGRIFDGQSYIDISDTIPQGLNSGINIFAGKNHGSILKDDGSMVSFGAIGANEIYNDGILPPNVTDTTFCDITGFVSFDLGETNQDKLNTNEKLAYRGSNITNKLSDDIYFPPDSGNLQNKVRIVMNVSKAGYIDAEPVTGEYSLVELAPEVSPETNVNYGPSIIVPNWDQDSAGALNVQYTLDGTDPATGAGTINSLTLVPNSGDFIHTISTGDFSNSTTLKVFAFSDVYLNSDVVSYTRQQLIAPTVTIMANGNILDITMSVPTPAGETRTPVIYYTLDGSPPTIQSYLYNSSISLQGSSTTVQAKAFLIGYIDSNTTIETYP